ncbi:hypothetical protein G4O51_07430 [Candidatus Bathyarchaeota archaeon A05DMB-2]|nr:hypothetical protein [Candidatus Bathyarchaeota archaeon A05DMB-2]
MVKALVVYYSMYGNTEKVAKALAAGLESGGVEADVVKVEAVRLDELAGVDLLCVGSPVHAWNASKPVKEFLERLKSAEGLAGKKAFAFDTKMRSKLAGSAGDKIERRLKDMGLTIAKHSESAIVLGRDGPLEEGAEETFKQIGTELAKNVVATRQVRRIKGIVVYDTSYGNTKKIGETIAETLKQSGLDVDVFYVKDVKKLSGKDYDFLVLGSPTKFGTMSFAVRGFLGEVKSEEWMNKPFAAFDTENPENVERAQAENKEWSAAEKIAHKLREKKMNQPMPVLKALVIGQKGPIVDGEIERTKDYARQFATKLK